jgi:hypothetical protein
MCPKDEASHPCGRKKPQGWGTELHFGTELRTAILEPVHSFFPLPIPGFKEASIQAGAGLRGAKELLRVFEVGAEIERDLQGK